MAWNGLSLRHAVNVDQSETRVRECRARSPSENSFPMTPRTRKLGSCAESSLQLEYIHTSSPSTVNTRFAVATHILTFLQTQQGEPATSELIASSVNTNPSLIRRLLTQLAKAGLTDSKMGTGGGAILARPAANISLLDVYLAVDEDADILPLHHTPNPKCPVGRNIQHVLEGRIDAAERALRESLAQSTIADLGSDIVRRERRRAVNS